MIQFQAVFQLNYVKTFSLMITQICVRKLVINHKYHNYITNICTHIIIFMNVFGAIFLEIC